MKLLDLFSGIGGFSLGLELAGFETIAFCEIEEFPRKVLAKHWPDVPIVGDIKKLTYKNGGLYDDGKEVYRGAIDALCGGYPCQPFSVAGKRRGQNDDRHLWPEYFRLIREIRPSWVIGENVAGHINMGLDDVLSDLESEGYTWEAFVIPACALGAHHRRDRIWIVANAYELGRGNTEIGKCRSKSKAEPGVHGKESDVANPSCERRDGSTSKRQKTGRNESTDGGENVGDATSERAQGLRASGEQEPQAHDWAGLLGSTSEGASDPYWQAEPRMGRVVDGVPNRVDRIKGLGNAVVPQIPEIIGRAIIQLANN